jgi:hypothetical protein
MNIAFPSPIGVRYFKNKNVIKVFALFSAGNQKFDFISSILKFRFCLTANLV